MRKLAISEYFVSTSPSVSSSGRAITNTISREDINASDTTKLAAYVITRLSLLILKGWPTLQICVFLDSLISFVDGEVGETDIGENDVWTLNRESIEKIRY
jgi:hypothetical protein